MEPASSIHLGNRYDRIGADADLERGQAPWYSSARPGKRSLILAFAAGMALTIAGYSIGNPSANIPAGYGLDEWTGYRSGKQEAVEGTDGEGGGASVVTVSTNWAHLG